GRTGSDNLGGSGAYRREIWRGALGIRRQVDYRAIRRQARKHVRRVQGGILGPSWAKTSIRQSFRLGLRWFVLAAIAMAAKLVLLQGRCFRQTSLLIAKQPLDTKAGRLSVAGAD